MAGRYSRTYTRKKSAAAPPISQFDRLVSEHGKSAHHPVASKTAGHVGKWGITSFTSLRSITESYGGKEETGKRTWLDSPPSSTTADPSSEASVIDTSKVAGPPKRRKFFKTRDCNNVSNSISSSSSNCEEVSPEIQSFSLNQNQGDEFNLQKCPQSVNSGSYKNIESASHLKNQKANTVLPSHKAGGGIKLKIFKSRNSDMNALETYSSSVQLPSDDSGSSSNSSSVANSPKPDPPLVVQTEANRVQSPNGLVLPDPLSAVCENDPVESLKENLKTDNLTLPTDVKAVSKLKEKIKPTSTNLGCLDKAQPDPVPPSPTPPDESETNAESFDKEQNGALNIPSQGETESVVSSNNTEDKVCYGFGEESEMEEPCLTPEEPGKGDLDRDMDLFSTDFDENEIVDRTSIEYPGSSANLNFNEVPLSRSDTIDLDDLEPSHSPSGSTFSSTRSSRSLTKSLSQQDYDSSKATSTKKRSIFKSRQKEGDPKKRATYKHKWHGHEEKDDNFKKEDLPQANSVSDKPNQDPFAFDTTPVLKRVQTWPATSQVLNDSYEEEPASVISVRCPRQAKKYYTVIKNVKKTHQLQESGEFQEFNDDVDYFLDALRSSNSLSTRCLASLNLAQKCMTPAFRMHLRAHATVTKFFRALSNAPSHSQLAECAAMVMFALSQDRLNMDLDRSSLELMLNLLDTDSNLSTLPDAAAADNSVKIRTLCQELQLKGHAKHLKVDKINAATLAMETLLSLTSKRAGEWFKEELRELGGVDHLIRTVTSSYNLFSASIQCWTPSLLDKLSKIDRCLKVLENVTHQNVVNQEYLLNHPSFSTTLMRLFSMCHTEVPLNPLKPDGDSHLALSTHNPDAAKGIVTTLITTIKVLINLTHGSSKEALGSQILGKDDKIYNISIYCLLLMPLYLDHDTKFEIQVLACCLLLNMVENSAENRLRLMNLRSPVVEEDGDEIFESREIESAMCSLVTLFYTSEESARIQEAHTDQIIDKDLVQENKEDEKKDEDIEETVARLLQKAGRHMEDTLIAAYTALLAGYCLMDNKDFEEKIRYMQPEGHFKTMVAVLKKFLHFMNLTATTSLLRSLKPTERVVKYMEGLDRSPEEEEEEKKKKEEAAQAMAFEAFGF